MKPIFVILPACNEEKHVGAVVRAVRKQGFSNVIVVDDGSGDKTGKEATRAGAKVLTHVVNIGKGAAMKTGADYAIAHNAKSLIFMDSDGQHRAEELPLFAKKLSQGNDIVFGARRRTSAMPIIPQFGNWFITTVIRMFYNLELHDALCGYRGLSAKAYKAVRWDSRDYSVESEMIARAGRNNLRYTEFEIATIYHDKHKGTTFLDGFVIVFNLIWWRMTH